MAYLVCSSTRTLRVHRLVMALIAICGFSAAAAAQTTVTLSTAGTQINADLTIQGGAYGYTDFSTSDTLASKVGTSDSYTRRILMKFDTQDYIPANAVIQSAQLYLVLKNAGSSQNRPMTAFYVNQSFVTGQTNWYYFRSGQAWNTPGGDLGANFGTTYVANAVGSAYAFDLTQMVQRIVNGEFGSRYTRLALVDTGGADSGNYREFYSTRALDPSVQPRLVVTYGGATSTQTTAPAPAPAPTPAPTTSGGSTLRVMQWNIHKTMGSDGICNPDRTTDTIIAQNIDVVSVNEVNFFSGTCAWTFDMSLKLQALLQQKTGVTWYMQNVNPNGLGNALLSRIAPVSASSFILDYGRGVAQMGIPVNGRIVNVFSTHVEYDTAWWRPIQITEAVNWMTNFSKPRITMGDFNTWPGTSDYYLIANTYQDAWAVAANAGVASSYNGTGATHGDSRFDYVFYASTVLSLNSVNVPNTLVNGVWPSDHDPVVAVFTVQ
jgi:endonuclease/exonuclease/phosphatase family metal-dependent hydrolase